MTNVHAGSFALLLNFVIRISFVIRHSPFSVHISRPDESPDRPAIGIFRSGGPAHGACDPDATPQERRPGCCIRRGGHGKHFRRANDERAGQVYDLARWHFFRAYLWIVGLVCPSRHRWRERVTARANETATYTSDFSCSGHGSTFSRFFSC